jgi:23S rRNA (cytidine1920-2'-O)/16S rRNA (cytidine1409-2'-O)-methyltransferase
MKATSHKPKSRLDQLLLDRGYFEDLKQAQANVMAGKVVVNGVVCSKPGMLMKSDAQITVRGVRLRYASRGGFKLEKALARFPLSVRGKVAFDAGAASGGFTDCLLKHGARLVYAVDVGYGQLKGRLAVDPRVVNWEKKNIGEVKKEELLVPIETCVADLSYLSLVKAVPILKSLFEGPYEITCLVKPLFEHLAQDQKSDPSAIKKVLEELFLTLQVQESEVVDVTVSPIFGSRESVEFLILLRPEGRNLDAATLAEKALQSWESEPPASVDAQMGDATDSQGVDPV